jgi:hypothetical protein
MARPNFGSSMHMNAFTKAKPSVVARKSFTYEGEGALAASFAACGMPDVAGAPSKKNRAGA